MRYVCVCGGYEHALQLPPHIHDSLGPSFVVQGVPYVAKVWSDFQGVGLALSTYPHVRCRYAVMSCEWFSALFHSCAAQHQKIVPTSPWLLAAAQKKYVGCCALWGQEVMSTVHVHVEANSWVICACVCTLNHNSMQFTAGCLNILIKCQRLFGKHPGPDLTPFTELLRAGSLVIFPSLDFWCPQYQTEFLQSQLWSVHLVPSRCRLLCHLPLLHPIRLCTALLRHTQGALGSPQQGRRKGRHDRIQDCSPRSRPCEGPCPRI